MRGAAESGVIGCRVRGRPEQQLVRREGWLPLPVRPTPGTTAFLDLSPQEHRQEERGKGGEGKMYGYVECSREQG